MDLIIRQMNRTELGILVGWAAEEGWNPGLEDAEIFWETDPKGYIAAELQGQMIGGGAIISYDGQFGFMGLFIIAPEFRGKGWGKQLWHARKEKLLQRLDNPVIGMDAVLNMQPFYAKGGFEFANTKVRYQTTMEQNSPANYLIEANSLDWQELLHYDTAHFPARREKFLTRWLQQAHALALAAIKQDKLVGYGMIRMCQSGYKIGPLFADTPEIAEDLFLALGNYADGQEIYIDIPENNPAAIALAKKYDMKEVFRCARMYYGKAPALPSHEIFGVTTAELG